MPDFNFHPASISGQVLDAVRNKQAREVEIQQSQQELKIKQEDHAMAQIQQTAANAASMVSGLVSSAKAKQHQEALSVLGKLMGERNKMVGGTKPQMAKTSMFGDVSVKPESLPFQADAAGMQTATPVPAVPYSTTPEYKTREMQALLKADPENYTKQALELAFSERMANGVGGAGGKGSREVKFKIMDPSGRQKTVVATRTAEGKLVNTLNNTEIKSAADLQTLPEAGYAQGFEDSGYTADGRKVVKDKTSGANYVVETSPDGQQSYTPYAGAMYPKPENAPASMVDSLSELEHGQHLLVNIADRFKPAFAGPLAGRYGSFKQYFDSLSAEDQVTFYQDLAEYKNSVIRAITGAQMNKDEVPRILGQLPNVNASPKAFLFGLQRSYDSAKDRISKKKSAMARAGYVMREGEAASEDDVEAAFDQAFSSLGTGDSRTVLDDGYDGLKAKAKKPTANPQNADPMGLR